MLNSGSQARDDRMSDHRWTHKSREWKLLRWANRGCVVVSFLFAVSGFAVDRLGLPVCGCVAFLILALVGGWFADRWRPITPPLDHCLHCGYNLTGNESGVCPECSTPVPKQETTA